MAHHPGLTQGEGSEDADHVELDKATDLGTEHDQKSRSDQCERDDPVGKDEPVAPVEILAGDQLVPGEDRRQSRKILVGGVGSQDQNCGREHLQRIKTEPAIECGSTNLRDDRPVLVDRVFRDPHVEPARQCGDAKKHRDRDGPHHPQRFCRIVCLGFTERLHAVSDGLDPGQGCRTRGESSQDQKESD